MSGCRKIPNSHICHPERTLSVAKGKSKDLRKTLAPVRFFDYAQNDDGHNLILILFITILTRSKSLSHWCTIRTRLKASIFGDFWIVVLERHEHSFVLRAKNPSKIQAFQVEEFKYNKNFCKQGKSTANT